MSNEDRLRFAAMLIREAHAESVTVSKASGEARRDLKAAADTVIRIAEMWSE